MKLTLPAEDPSCPDAAELRAFREGRMSTPEMAALMRHAEGCKACQARLQGGARIIPFTPRGARVVPPEDARRSVPQVALVGIIALLLAVCGFTAGRLVTEVRRPEIVLSRLLRQISPEGLVLGPIPASLLSFEGQPLRLAAERAAAPHPMATEGEGGYSPSFSELDRRWMELATLEAIDQRAEPRLLQGYAYLNVAQARAVGDLEPARAALVMARDEAPDSVEVLSDLAALTALTGGPGGVEEASRMLERAVEMSPVFAPALYNRAILARGRVAAEEERGLVMAYLDVEGASPWASDLRDRYDELEAWLGGPPLRPR